MKEFFKPWRRKVGVVTLLMACVFMAGWVRSMAVVDHWCNSDFTSYYSLINSGEGVIAFGLHRHVQKSKWKFLNGYFSGYHRFTPSHDRIDQLFPESAGWKANVRFELFGVKVINAENNSPWREAETAIVHVPYWLIVVPLTALSAFLLLSKPRKSTQKKITGPIQDGGGGAS